MPIVSMPGHLMRDVQGQLDWTRWRETKVMYFRGESTPCWVDRDRIVYRITEIPSQHLQHLERWLLGRGAEDIPARKKAYDAGYYNIVRDELERRGLPTFEDHPTIQPQHEDFNMPTIEEPRERIATNPSIAEYMAQKKAARQNTYAAQLSDWHRRNPISTEAGRDEFGSLA